MQYNYFHAIYPNQIYSTNQFLEPWSAFLLVELESDWIPKYGVIFIYTTYIFITYIKIWRHYLWRHRCHYWRHLILFIFLFFRNYRKSKFPENPNFTQNMTSSYLWRHNLITVLPAGCQLIAVYSLDPSMSLTSFFSSSLIGCSFLYSTTPILHLYRSLLSRHCPY